jgi:hypothetical protein
MMTKRAALFSIVLAVGLVWVVPAFAQTPSPAVAPSPLAIAQEAGQTVRAAIPAQAPRPPAAPTPAPSPAAAPRAPEPQEMQLDNVPNVRVDVTISYQVGQGAVVRRTASLMVASGESGSLRAGNQVAVPSTSFMPAPAGTVRAESAAPAPPTPMTSFSYRAIGLNVDARRVRVGGNRAKLDLSVEFSAVDEKAADSGSRPPSFPTFSQNLSLVLESGKPVVIAQTNDVVDNVERKQSVEVKATILR